MNLLWTCSLSDYVEIMEQAIILGKQRGKKEGDCIEKEFFEIAKQKSKELKCLGKTEQDKDLLCGNLREQGLKVVNPDEEIRRKEL